VQEFSLLLTWIPTARHSFFARVPPVFKSSGIGWLLGQHPTFTSYGKLGPEKMLRKSEEQEEAELALLSSEDDSASIATTSDLDDLEANRKDEPIINQNTEIEYQTPTTVKFIWLTCYFGFSMALTIYNKLVLGSVRISYMITTVATANRFNSSKHLGS
jgi:hypothetical protein